MTDTQYLGYRHYNCVMGTHPKHTLSSSTTSLRNIFCPRLTEDFRWYSIISFSELNLTSHRKYLPAPSLNTLKCWTESPYLQIVKTACNARYNGTQLHYDQPLFELVLWLSDNNSTSLQGVSPSLPSLPLPPSPKGMLTTGGVHIAPLTCFNVLTLSGAIPTPTATFLQ